MQKLYCYVDKNGQHGEGRNYVEMTVQTTASVIKSVASSEYKTTVLVDGLKASERRSFATALRHYGVRTNVVRGLDDKKDVFIRLADALCGLIVDALEENQADTRLLNRAEQNGFVTRLK